ncbi:MAG: glycolate oxidase subunit GlcE, partial [Sulfitobacter sp.]|nr:glycolate oxidase subunit GlcE [Sulfitobacter sp.]
MAITSEEALIEAVKGAAGPISVQGGGTRGLPATGQVMSLAGLQGITLYE